LAELRAHEQQAALELSQWQTKTVQEERKTLDATPAAVALATILTLEQLEELEQKIRSRFSHRRSQRVGRRYGPHFPARRNHRRYDKRG